MDALTIYLTGGFFVAAFGVLSGYLGFQRGGLAWGAAWLSLMIAGAFRTFADVSPAFPPAAALLGGLTAPMLLFGSWRFMRGRQPVPQHWVVVFAVALFVRLVLQPAMPELWDRAYAAVLGTICIAMSCALFLRPPTGSPLPGARALAMTFPSIAILAWFDTFAPGFGFEPVVSIAAWFVVGVVHAVLTLGIYIRMGREEIDTLRDEARLLRDRETRLTSHFRRITDETRDLICECDLDGRVRYANPAHRETLGVDPAKLEGSSIFDWGIQGAEEFKNQLHRDRAAALVSKFEVTHEDGTPITLETHVRTFVDAAGKTRVLATSRDVTAREASDRAQAEARDRLEAMVAERTRELARSMQELQRSERLAAMGTMAAGIAHQINNPVGSIRMSAEYALRADDADPGWKRSIRESLENCIQQASRCGQIVSGLLQFARDEEGSREVEDLRAVTARACDVVRPIIRDQGAVIECRPGSTPIPVRISAIQIEQAIVNLLYNANEAGATEIDVRVEREGGGGGGGGGDDESGGEKARLSVRDNGRGMSAPEVDRAFEPFFTTRLARGGTGLGLSVAHGVITSHGGQVQIESTPGEGTRIDIVLELEAEPS